MNIGQMMVLRLNGDWTNILERLLNNLQQKPVSFISPYRVRSDIAVVLYPRGASLPFLLLFPQTGELLLHPLHGNLLIPELAPLLCGLGHNSRRNVYDPHSSLHLIHILASLSSTVELLDAVFSI